MSSKNSKNQDRDYKKKDPFLVRPDTLKKYGKELLDNALVRRTMFSAKRQFIDLAKEFGMGNVAVGPPAQIPALTEIEIAALAEKYDWSRRTRRKLDAKTEAVASEEAEAMQSVTMMARGEMTERRLRDIEIKKKKKKKEKRLKFPYHDDAKSEHKKAFDQRLRIAAIGYRVKISKRLNNPLFGEDLCPLPSPPTPQEIGLPDTAGIHLLGRTTYTKDASKEKWVETICDHINVALEQNSQFVLLPEFAMPPANSGTDFEKRIADCCAAAVSQQHDRYIFAGTRHEGGYNRGLIVKLKKPPTGAAQSWHYKIASARSLGENVLGPRMEPRKPDTAEVTLNNLPYEFGVTVAVCYDTFDPSTFLRLAVQSRLRGRRLHEDIILVPAFNPSSVFVEYLRDLSFLTRSTVVYINGLHGDAQMFISGILIDDLHDEGRAAAIAKIEVYTNKLHKDHRKELKKYKELIEAGEIEKADGYYRKAEKIKGRRVRVQGFLAAIESLQGKNALKDLVTVERCPECKTESHTDDYNCRSDILYYNIDVHLLEAIRDLQEQHIFNDDSFLPAPFQKTALSESLKLLIKKSDSDSN